MLGFLQQGHEVGEAQGSSLHGLLSAGQTFFAGVEALVDGVSMERRLEGAALAHYGFKGSLGAYGVEVLFGCSERGGEFLAFLLVYCLGLLIEDDCYSMAVYLLLLLGGLLD